MLGEKKKSVFCGDMRQDAALGLWGKNCERSRSSVMDIAHNVVKLQWTEKAMQW